MDARPRIAILLSTYNGEKFLGEQLDSILNQTYSDFLIVARDDGSNDGTLAILSAYAGKNPQKFHLVDSDSTNRGASGSFSYLTQYVLENKQRFGLDRVYMMFCDQDDVWYANKIEAQLAAMLQAEASDPSSPILVHTDLQVVSDDDAIIADSLIRFQGLEIARNRFPNLVISNLVTGCTALLNEALAEKMVPVPSQAIMHDWWSALVATAFGRLIFLDTPLVHYRQHDSNTIGAKEYVKPNRISLREWRRHFESIPVEHLFEVAVQAEEFRRIFGKQLGIRQSLALRISSLMKFRVGYLQKIFFWIARRL